MPTPTIITSPEHPAMDDLCQQLGEMATQLSAENAWVGDQLTLCGKYGVFQWFLPEALGGQGWSEADLVRGYLRLSAACLTTTFVITQRTGACKRIAAGDSDSLREQLLPDLLTGKSFATVGISHLTTSRRHLSKPVLQVEQTDEGYRLHGFSPWVTGAPFAEHTIVGGTLADGREILIALPMDLPGVSTPSPPQLIGLNASQTGRVDLDNVQVSQQQVLAGPIENVIASGVGAKTGGLQTSTLALGLATAAVEFLQKESQVRDDLLAATDQLEADVAACQRDLLAAAEGEPRCTNEELRTRANSLVLRATQAALAAAKGAGYVTSHPAGRWCCEALFFLVWSCPQPVLSANLCELAGLSVE